MFHYFGYGSNLSWAGLRSKGVEPSSAEAAVLREWRLAFNINHPFAFEGKVANVVPAIGHEVHGALYACSDECLSTLDEFEGLGLYYDRHLLEVKTYAGECLSAHVYVGLTGMLSDEGRPSQRYRSLLYSGGIKLGLSAIYLEQLASLATYPAPNFGPFVPPLRDAPLYTVAQALGLPGHTVIAGHLFDLSSAGPHQQTIVPLLEGRDVTQFFLERMHNADDLSLPEALEAGSFDRERRRYLNDYLHAFTSEYRYVGRIADDDTKSDASV
ncbi:MAG: gamma-glutamylcyclotransferase [Proteobacteria bacterium]|nr:gamma-glutamylcyclotransferase [Pseudomonadota bacterium]